MASRLITPALEERLKSYPLYSQDGKGKDAVCVAIFFIGHVRWFVLEGQPEGNDTTLFTIVCGLHETEYGYTSVNEMESVKVDGSKYGVDEIFQEHGRYPLHRYGLRMVFRCSQRCGKPPRLLQAGETEEHSRRGFTDFPE